MRMYENKSCRSTIAPFTILTFWVACFPFYEWIKEDLGKGDDMKDDFKFLFVWTSCAFLYLIVLIVIYNLAEDYHPVYLLLRAIKEWVNTRFN